MDGWNRLKQFGNGMVWNLEHLESKLWSFVTFGQSNQDSSILITLPVCHSFSLLFSFLVVLGFELRASHLLGQCSSALATPPGPGLRVLMALEAGALWSLWSGSAQEAVRQD
jgi:hypothetical protein